MKATLLVVVLLLLSSLASTSLVQQSPSKVPVFGKIVLVTFDGARSKWIDFVIENGYAPSLARLRREGVNVTLDIVSHNPSTDPGLANIETGYGADVTRVVGNTFATLDPKLKSTIPKGLTTFERIKAVYGASWKTALVMPWAQAPINVTTNVDSIFWNTKSSVDFWFSAENMTWWTRAPDYNSWAWADGLFRADFTAKILVDRFIRPNAGSNFYARTHWIEPDEYGHAYGESGAGDTPSPRYIDALITVDRALGIIVKGLEDAGIYDETLLLVSTDHGFLGSGHSGPPKPRNDPRIYRIWLMANKKWFAPPGTIGIQDDISPSILNAAGIDVDFLKPEYSKTSGALPLRRANTRENIPPKVVVFAPKSISEGSIARWNISATDLSGISLLELVYTYGAAGELVAAISQTASGEYSAKSIVVRGIDSVNWVLRVFDNSTLKNEFSTAGSFPVMGAQPTPRVEEAPYSSLLTPYGYTIAILAVVAGIVVLALYLKRR